ncbi:MAG: hypothetical protein ABIZ52_01460, partial [Candidatus Limnocylindrales bacterium]
ELAEEGIDPLAFRYLCLTARYARKLNLSEESLVGAAGGLASLRAEVAALGPAPVAGPWVPPPVLRAGSSPARPIGRAHGPAGHGDGSPLGFQITDRAAAAGVPLSPEGRVVHDRFAAAIDDDLDTPAALRIAREALRSAIPMDERRWLALDMDFVLGLDLHESVPRPGGPTPAETAADLPPEGVWGLLEARARARAAHQWAEADRMRDALRDLGVEPIDRADGTTDWRALP